MYIVFTVLCCRTLWASRSKDPDAYCGRSALTGRCGKLCVLNLDSSGGSCKTPHTTLQTKRAQYTQLKPYGYGRRQRNDNLGLRSLVRPPNARFPLPASANLIVAAGNDFSKTKQVRVSLYRG